MHRAIWVSLLILLLAGGTAEAADATAAVDVNSAYVWRGITFNDGAVAQPSIDVSKGGFAVNVWGNFDIDDYDEQLDDNEFSEIDLTLSYTFTLKSLEIGLGYIEYLFPAGGLGTREVFVSLGVPLFGGLSAGCAFYYDFDEVDSYYGDVNLTYALSLTDQLGMEAKAKIGYAGEDFAEVYGGTDGGFFDYGFSLSLSYAVTDALSLGAAINYTDTVDEDVLPEGDFAHDTEWYGGVRIAYTF